MASKHGQISWLNNHMPTYLVHESKYYSIIASFLLEEISGSVFVENFMKQWRIDRDNQWEEIRSGTQPSTEEYEFCGMLDRIFTACDCFTENPDSEYDIDEIQLRTEVRSNSKLRWKDLN